VKFLGAPGTKAYTVLGSHESSWSKQPAGPSLFARARAVAQELAGIVLTLLESTFSIAASFFQSMLPPPKRD
jgi:hypothetical protein